MQPFHKYFYFTIAQDDLKEKLWSVKGQTDSADTKYMKDKTKKILMVCMNVTAKKF